MNTPFTPVINISDFEEVILKKQDNEGSNPLVVNIIDERIRNTDIYTSFINLCRYYRIEVQSFIRENSCHVIISVNGSGSLSMIYEDQSLDISTDLASVLYRELSVQIRNRDFIQKNQ